MSSSSGKGLFGNSGGFLGTGLFSGKTGMGFEGISKAREIKAKKLQKKAATAAIDEVTRQEILSMDPIWGKDLDNITNMLNDAQEGTKAKFKARMETQQLFNNKVRQPDAERLRGQRLDFGSFLRK